MSFRFATASTDERTTLSERDIELKEIDTIGAREYVDHGTVVDPLAMSKFFCFFSMPFNIYKSTDTSSVLVKMNKFTTYKLHSHNELLFLTVHVNWPEQPTIIYLFDAYHDKKQPFHAKYLLEFFYTCQEMVPGNVRCLYVHMDQPYAVCLFLKAIFENPKARQLDIKTNFSLLLRDPAANTPTIPLVKQGFYIKSDVEPAMFSWDNWNQYSVTIEPKKLIIKSFQSQRKEEIEIYIDKVLAQIKITQDSDTYELSRYYINR